MLHFSQHLRRVALSLTISIRTKAESKGWRYKGIEEGRGFKTGRLDPPFYVRRNKLWHRLSAQTFEAAKVERDEIESGTTSITTDGRVTLKAAVEQFLEV